MTVITGTAATELRPANDTIDCVLEAIGNTPCVPISACAPRETRLYLKMEHLNPTGTVYDRLATAVAFLSDRIHFDNLAAAAPALTLAAKTVGIEPTLSEDTPTTFGYLAEAYGARRVPRSESSGFDLDTERATKQIVDEIRADGLTAEIVMPELPLFGAQELTQSGIRAVYAGRDSETRTALAKAGIFVDEQTAAVVREVVTRGWDDAVVVCAADGALG